LTAADWPYAVNSVFNAGATIFSGKVLLLVRAEDHRGFSHLCKATSVDGYTDWQIDTKPTMLPDTENYPEEFYGIEDPRIVRLDSSDTYAIAYTSYSQTGPLVSLATTTDFITFERHGIIMHPEDKDASMFPRKFNGRWALLHRPSPRDKMNRANIWISYSSDLMHWGEGSCLIEARKGGWWDAVKIGIGPQPIETPEGWLIIYHGVKTTGSGSLYRLGLALLDLENPMKVIKRCDQWVFGPEELYERVGDVPGVTFPCGAVVRGDELIMYYGAADSSVAIATSSVKDILLYIRES
jgi:predicted GH43/DUF377 family glycosyl hydrolase